MLYQICGSTWSARLSRHPAYSYNSYNSAKRYISIRHSGKASSIRAAVPDMRCGGGAPKKERGTREGRDGVVVGIRIHEWGDISYAWLPQYRTPRIHGAYEPV